MKSAPAQETTGAPLDAHAVRADFPIFAREIGGRPPPVLPSAPRAQKPPPARHAIEPPPPSAFPERHPAGHAPGREWLDAPDRFGGIEMLISGAGGDVNRFAARDPRVFWHDDSWPVFFYVVADAHRFTGRGELAFADENHRAGRGLSRGRRRCVFARGRWCLTCSEQNRAGRKCEREGERGAGRTGAVVDGVARQVCEQHWVSGL